MVFKKGVVIVCLLLALVFGYDIWRANTGTFTVIRRSDYVEPLPDDGMININTADEEQLQELKGIGPSLAKRIVEYRQTTPFTSIEDILNVNGIGESKFEDIKDSIKIE